jgi:predicted Rossmann-fold nucleotide-binding protein
MPGGVGTLEEIVEQITWAQLGRHKKPVLLANIKGFWQPLCALFEHMKTLEFIRAGLDFELLVANKADDILPMLEQAAASVSEHDKQMKTIEPERL